MRHRPFASSVFAQRGQAEFKDSLTLAEFEDAAGSWLLDSEIRLSRNTVVQRRFLVEKLTWWLKANGCEVVGQNELKQFMLYLRTAHEKPEGRWGEPGKPCTDPRCKRPMRPRSMANYFRWLRTFWLYLVEDGTLDVSPLAKVRAPAHRDDQIKPLSEAQIQALLAACRATKSTAQARRDEALVLLMLDTGARAGEVCGLRYRDFNLRERSVWVRGKGDTHRTLYLSPRTVRAIMDYLRYQRRDEEDALFQAVRGITPGEPMHADGLGDAIRRLGKVAGIEGVRCSPHTLRHTFALGFLRNGGDPLSLQILMGHTDLSMTRRYVLLAGSDLKKSHASYSPVAHLKRTR